MSDPIYQFQWTVPDAGYEVVSTSEWLDQPYSPEKEERFLVEKLTGDDSWIKQYTPLILKLGCSGSLRTCIQPPKSPSLISRAGLAPWVFHSAQLLGEASQATAREWPYGRHSRTGS